MDAVLLKERPVAGQFEEHQFGASNDVTWVKFTDEDHNEWCGRFENGPRNKVKLVRLGDTSRCLVIARGNAFVADMNSRQGAEVGTWDNISDAVYCELADKLVLTDGTTIIVASKETVIWQSERLSYDWICFDGCTGMLVKGWLSDLSEDGSDFTFNVETRELQGKWFYYRGLGPAAAKRDMSGKGFWDNCASLFQRLFDWKKDT